MDIQYLSSNIVVKSVKGKSLAEAAAMPRDEAKKFQSDVKDAYRKLIKLGTGAALVRAIEQTGKRCTVFCTDTSGTALSDPPDLANNVARMVKSFRPQHHNMVSMTKKTMIVRTPVKDVSGKVIGETQATQKGTGLINMKDQLRQGGFLQDKNTASMELDYVLVRAWGDVERGRNALVRELAKSRVQIDAMCDGQAKIDDNDYYKICFAYYDYLTPGRGCNSQVKLLPGIRLLNGLKPYDPKNDADCVPPEIMLGHELIHAWRMMAGRRIVNDGWEEEAMTTGLHPFSHLAFTENRLRMDAGYPGRQKYEMRIFNSRHAQDIYLA